MSERVRCGWAAKAEFWDYHDLEWGVPVHDDRKHFEFLVLEGAQAGLSWSTILAKREGYRRAFAGFDPEAIVAATPGFRRDARYQQANGFQERRSIRLQARFSF